MKRYTVTFTEIEKFLLTNYNQESLEKAFPQFATEELWESIDKDNTDANDISYFASETNHWDKINTSTLSVNPSEDEITYQYGSGAYIPNITKRLNDFADWVMRSYDQELYPWENNAWETLGLSGDDDVDYNGSYLIFLAEIIEIYITLKHNK